MKHTKHITLVTLLLIAVLVMVACDSALQQTPQEPTPAQTASPQATATEAAQSTESTEQTPQPSENTSEATVASVVMTGAIQEVLDETDQIHVTGTDDANPVNDVIANISDDTVIIDAQASDFVDEDTLKIGDTVQVTVDEKMTFSLPPMSNAYMVVTNLPQDSMGIPTYIIANEVTMGTDGSVAVLNQNKDTVVTIPVDLAIDVREEPDGDVVNRTVTPADLKQGDVLLAWYDFVAASFPGQATATKAMLIVND